MDWLLDRREKSLANSAQRIVADMHRHLDREKKRNKDLEGMIIKFHHLCTDSLENELERLELRRKELQTELDSIDVTIADRKSQLERAREDVRSILMNTKAEDDETQKNSLVMGGSKISEDKACALEEQYLEESDLLATVKDIVAGTLFLIHRNDCDDAFSYAPTPDHGSGSADMVTCTKIVNLTGSKPAIGELSMLEAMMTYSAKIVPNHDRDYPDIRELPVPFSIAQALAATGAQLNHTHNHSHSHPKKAPGGGGSNASAASTTTSSSSSSTAVSSSSSHQGHVTSEMGHLVGAFEIALIPDVVVDVWCHEDSYWVTTTVDNINFAVLERIFVSSEVAWGVSTVVQIDLFGRHPKNGFLIIESIVATPE